MAHTLAELSQMLAAVGMPSTIDGDSSRQVRGVATLEEAGPEEISFLSNAKYERALQSTAAGVVIVSRTQSVPAGMTVLRTQDPYAALTAVMVHIHGYRRHPHVGIDPRAVIDATASIGPGANIHHGASIAASVVIGSNVTIYPGCYIAQGCRLGDDCVLYPNVVIYDGSILGHRVTVHAGSVIGEDGLGYAQVKGRWFKIPQIGVVEIADDVEIGANCCVDRATLGRTVIGRGTKFSNLIAIGHGTKVGEDCMFVAQVGIAGSTTVGNNVKMAGKAGVAGHLNIGDNAEVAAMAGVMEDVPADTSVAGAPALPRKEMLRSWAHLARLPEIHKQIKSLEARLAQLQRAIEAAEDGEPTRSGLK